MSITNMKTSKVIQDIRVYRSNEIDSDHYLLCAKVNFPLCRTLKRLLDTWERNGSTSGPTTWQIYDDDYNVTRTSNPLREDLCTFIMSRWILLRKRNFSDKIFRENESLCSKLFS